MDKNYAAHSCRRAALEQARQVTRPEFVRARVELVNGWLESVDDANLA